MNALRIAVLLVGRGISALCLASAACLFWQFAEAASTADFVGGFFWFFLAWHLAWVWAEPVVRLERGQ